MTYIPSVGEVRIRYQRAAPPGQSQGQAKKEFKRWLKRYTETRQGAAFAEGYRQGRLAMSTTIKVTAVPWSGGWSLVFGDGHATQVADIANAERQVRDYLDTLYPEVDHSNTRVQITYQETGA